MAPVQLQNGHKDIMTEENTLKLKRRRSNIDIKSNAEKLSKKESSSTATSSSTTSSCTVCGKVKPNDIVDLSTNEIMRDTLINYYKMTKLQIKDTLSSLCVQCVYKINIQREMARTLELRLHHRTNGHTILKNSFIRTPELRSSRRLINQKASPDHCPSNSSSSRSSSSSAHLNAQTNRGTHYLRNNNNSNSSSSGTNVPEAKTIITKGKRKKRAKSVISINDEQCREKTLKSTFSAYSDANGIIVNKCKNFNLNNGLPTNQRTFKSLIQFSTCSISLTTKKTNIPPVTHHTQEETNQLPKPQSEQHQQQQSQEEPEEPEEPAPRLVLDQRLVSIDPQPSPSALLASQLDQPSVDAASNEAPAASSFSLEDDTENVSMLEVLSERPESVLLTESGHFLNRYNTANEPNKFVCSNCGKQYWREFFYKKHIRRCAPRYPYTKSNTGNETGRTKASTQCQLQQQQQRRATKARSERVFYCGYCDVTKSSLNELKQHQDSHLPHFECPTCNQVFQTAFSFDFHVAECISKSEALDEQLKKGDESPPKERHQTRSMSQAASRAPTSESNSSVHRFKLNKNAEKKNRDKANDDGYTNADDDDDDDDDDDAVSVADSTYSQRMTNTSDWINALAEPTNWEEAAAAATAITQNYFTDDDAFCEDLQLTSYKEYDLYLLDIFKLQVECSFFRCLENGCDYRAYELLDAMLHDYKEHWNHSWFFCRKCGCMFTRKVHLDYHLHHQNSGRYICFKCSEVFLYQHELDRHLVKHAKCVNYRCNYCQSEFLSESALELHCDLKQHDPNVERTLVHIDRSMTISNDAIENPIDDSNAPPNQTNTVTTATTTPTTTTTATNSTCHNIRIIEMHLPPVPSKYTPYGHTRHIIGEFEFKNQNIPNCAGWKYED